MVPLVAHSKLYGALWQYVCYVWDIIYSSGLQSLNYLACNTLSEFLRCPLIWRIQLPKSYMCWMEWNSYHISVSLNLTAALVWNDIFQCNSLDHIQFYQIRAPMQVYGSTSRVPATPSPNRLSLCSASKSDSVRNQVMTCVVSAHK